MLMLAIVALVIAGVMAVVCVGAIGLATARIFGWLPPRRVDGGTVSEAWLANARRSK
jgi:threonine dehydrogenase-like Zn-dependent dehydrogenase